MTDERDDRRSLADDPDFLASLSGLERGLTGAEAGAPPDAPRDVQAPTIESPPPASAPRVAPPVETMPVHEPAPLPLWLLPIESLAHLPPPEPALPSPSEPSAPSASVPLEPVASSSPPSRRLLLDLFPVARPPAVAMQPPPTPASAPAPARAPVPEPPLTPSVQEYETFYGFEDKPFGPSTDPKFFFHSASHDRAAQTLLSAIRAREGIVVITGRAGLGKTMLCRTVIEQLDRRTLTSLVDGPSLTVDDLLRILLCDFGVISREDVTRGKLRTASQRELVAALRDFLQSLVALQAGAVAFLDGADRVSTDVLEQIRAWADAETELRLLQFVLIGEPVLTARLRRKELRPLNDRVAVRIVIEPIAPDELDGYVAHRLVAAGTNPRIEFDPRASAAMYAPTAGVPRDINLLCDRALVKGHSVSAAVIDAGVVTEAANELELVAPETASAKALRRVGLTLAFVLLVAVGAAVAAFLFQEPFDRLVQHWVQPPSR